MIRAGHPHAQTLLDVACGTGEHARLAASPRSRWRGRASEAQGGADLAALLAGVGLRFATWGRPIVLPSAGVDFGWFR
ncbi:hypothetical protein ACMHYB_50200 [Sorangium sp. So ce1128]